MKPKFRIKRRSVFALAVIAAGAVTFEWTKSVSAQSPMQFAGPTNSQPIAITADDAFVAAVNPDNNSVSFFDARQDRNRKLVEVPVGTEPNGVALSPAGNKAYIANTGSGTVSILTLNLRNGQVSRTPNNVQVGTEPYAICITPNGSKLFVLNARSGNVSVIDTLGETVVATINVGPEPRGCAITNDGDDDDNDEKIYVTQFLSRTIPGKIDSFDDAKEGVVYRVNVASYAVEDTTIIDPLPVTGFKANGDALAGIPPAGDFNRDTGAYPNQFNSLAIKGNKVYLPNTGASPNGPVRFNVNTQSLLSFFDIVSEEDATINMHLAVAAQTNPARRFITVPWSIAMERTTADAWVVSAASDHLVRLTINPGTGVPSVAADPSDPTRVHQIFVGKNPRGLAINSTDTRAYVMNYISRSVSVIDLNAAAPSVIATVQSAALPTAGSDADKIHAGKELYNSSTGVFDPAPGTTTPIAGRMSAEGWGSCSSCHPFGLSDGVAWIFASGPRRTIGQHTDFDQTDPARSIMRALNWSAFFDEQEDFENNIRGTSGGLGLIVAADNVTPDTPTPNFTPIANGGRNQLKIRGFGAWDAIKSYVQFGIRTPISPVPATNPDVIAGRALFAAANCQQCHGGAQWTSARVRFIPPPDPALIVNSQIIGELRQVGTFDAAFPNEKRANGAVALGADGLTPASLLGLHSIPEGYLHGSAAATLTDVMNNVTHRASGTGGVDTLANPADRAKVIQFLLSIDASTPIFPQP